MASSLLKPLQKLIARSHVFVYRISGGKIGAWMNGSRVLLLTTTGRKTGASRTTPVAFIYKDDAYLVAAASGGSAQNPAWFLNLESTPEATIELEGRQIRVRAAIISGRERDQLYELFKATYPGFSMVERWTTRKIPVIRLQPITSESSSANPVLHTL